MRNFPTPYHDELIYSTVARAAVHQCFLSPKLLLEDVYGNRNAIATYDLPNYLSKVAAQLVRTGQCSPLTLIYNNTMFPLYAPFVTERQRRKAITLMMGESRGGVHLLLGVAASLVKAPTFLRYCPECLQAQENTFGEAYWARCWHLPGIDVCSEHGRLHQTSIVLNDHRHLFVPCRAWSSGGRVRTDHYGFEAKLARMAGDLLKLKHRASPGCEKWSAFYKALAQDLGYTTKSHVRHEDIWQRLKAAYPYKWLKEVGLDIAPSDESNWLRRLFRKHRRSFSYLQHALVWAVLLPETSVDLILDRVHQQKLPVDRTALIEVGNRTRSETTDNKRKQWEELATVYGVKGGRERGSSGAIYAWLYRNDRAWLLAYNSSIPMPSRTAGGRVDWAKRDAQIARRLFRILYDHEGLLGNPRMSAAWFCHRLDRGNSVSKNLNKLPKVRIFLERYSETITEYQLRRLANAWGKQESRHKPIQDWELLRAAGLSDQRMTAGTKVVFTALISE